MIKKSQDKNLLKSKLPSFSIIIPTRNRAQSLALTVHYLSKINYPKNLFEIIIVNNNPSDDQVKNLIHKSKIDNLRYLEEKKRGATFARNTGIAHAKNRNLIFLDDDILVPPTFLSGYHEAIEKYPQAKILGGAIVAKLPKNSTLTKEQQSLLDWYPWCFANKQLKSDLILGADNFLFSANMCYRRSKDSQEIFSPKLGVQFFLEDLIGAEDFELCVRTTLAKQQVVFVTNEKIRTSHLVSRKRLTHRYLEKRHVRAGIEMYILEQVIKTNFPQFTSFYLRRTFSPRGLYNLFNDKYAQLMLFSYIFNGRYFFSK